MNGERILRGPEFTDIEKCETCTIGKRQRSAALSREAALALN
jgi:hypothetical protein